jgi:hypothetical protein
MHADSMLSTLQRQTGDRPNVVAFRCCFDWFDTAGCKHGALPCQVAQALVLGGLPRRTICAFGTCRSWQIATRGGRELKRLSYLSKFWLGYRYE